MCRTDGVGSTDNDGRCGDSSFGFAECVGNCVVDVLLYAVHIGWRFVYIGFYATKPQAAA